MRLRVYIECAACGRKHEVWVLGGWDISHVHHHCVGEPSQSVGGRETKEGEFVVEFDPKRVMV